MVDSGAVAFMEWRGSQCCEVDSGAGACMKRVVNDAEFIVGQWHAWREGGVNVAEGIVGLWRAG